MARRFDDTAQGSFTAWGSGFHYEYMSGGCVLDITDPIRKEPVARLKFDSYLLKDPLGYVRYLDRANKIKALTFSNNRTVDLAGAVDRNRMGAILKSTARNSYYAHSLNFADFERFSELFSREFGLQHVRIKKFVSKDQNNSFFVARIQTQRDNSVSVRGCTLPGLMAALSEKTMRDLVTTEFGSPSQNAAQTLLRVSSKLYSIGVILDPYFEPETRVKSHPLPNREESETL